jgi:hypothetical protein
MDDPAAAHTDAGVAGIRTHYSAARMADDVLAAYRDLVASAVSE